MLDSGLGVPPMTLAFSSPDIGSSVYQQALKALLCAAMECRTSNERYELSREPMHQSIGHALRGAGDDDRVRSSIQPGPPRRALILPPGARR